MSFEPFRHNRRTFVGGSDARIIMGLDEAALVRLWREKRGEAEPEDLSGNLLVQLEVATEALNRTWYERNTSRRIVDVRFGCAPWKGGAFQWVRDPPGNRSSRKQPEQSWRQRSG